MIANNELLSNVPEIQFYPPSELWDDPAAIVARHETDHGDFAVYGKIYADGSCSCADFKVHGRCFHATMWAVAWAVLRRFDERREEQRRARLVDIFAGEITLEDEARYGPGASYTLPAALQVGD